MRVFVLGGSKLDADLGLALPARVPGSLGHPSDDRLGYFESAAGAVGLDPGLSSSKSCPVNRVAAISPLDASLFHQHPPLSSVGRGEGVSHLLYYVADLVNYGLSTVFERSSRPERRGEPDPTLTSAMVVPSVPEAAGEASVHLDLDREVGLTEPSQRLFYQASNLCEGHQVCHFFAPFGLGFSFFLTKI